MKEFGKLIELEPRHEFNDERADFTPWLNDNIKIISDLLGIEIVDNQIEEPVGDFSVDIRGKVANSDKVVVIENQLEKTDHTHLGQIVTYTSGLHADVIIWIAKEIRPEHQEALEWLNKNTEAQFFGLQVKLLQIDDSKPAINFEIKVRPSNWTNQVKKIKASVSSRNQLYQEFFTELIERFNKEYRAQAKIKALPQSWAGIGGGKTGFWFNWTFRGNKRFSVELIIDVGDQSKNKQYFDRLSENQNAITKELSWERLDQRQSSRIAVYTNGDIQDTMSDEKEKERLIAWGIEKMRLFIVQFKPIITSKLD